MVRIAKVFTMAVAFIAVFGGLYFLRGESQKQGASQNAVKVLSYSAFVNAWGAGPEIASRFESKYGLHVDFQDAGDAGLLLQKLALFPADVVVGLDQFSIVQAKEKRKWRKFGSDPEFQAFDQAPIDFVYRNGEVSPPKSLSDLLDPRFKDAIVIEDPSTSTLGLQFFYWVLDEMGVEAGFDFLRNLKDKGSLRAVAASWSLAYGLFTKNEAKLALSYLTSPVYHWSQEKDRRYLPAVFDNGLPVQTEYVAAPDSCLNCTGAELFIHYLLTPEIQKIIMQKNYMMPMLPSVSSQTEFAELPHVKEYVWKNLPALLRDREALLQRWRQLNL